MNRRRAIVSVGLVAVLAVASCSGDDDGGGEGSAEPVDFGAPGPYDVGVADFEVTGKQIAVFYPADDAATDAEPYAYSGAELFGAELAAQLPAHSASPRRWTARFVISRRAPTHRSLFSSPATDSVAISGFPACTTRRSRRGVSW